MRGQRHAILRLTLDAVVGGHVFGGFGHGVHAVLRLHQLVHKAPADRRVIDRVIARVSALGFGHDEGRTTHAFDATSNHESGLATLDGTRRGTQRVQARTAKAVDGGAWHFQRQSGQQGTHVCHIAVILASLVGAAKDHVRDRLPVHAGVARHQRAQGYGAEVVGAYAGECTAVATEGGANCVADVGISGHLVNVSLLGRVMVSAISISLPSRSESDKDPPNIFILSPDLYIEPRCC